MLLFPFCTIFPEDLATSPGIREHSLREHADLIDCHTVTASAAFKE
jgi:hypothetical protein